MAAAPDLHIVLYPDPVLRQKAAPIKHIDDHVRAVGKRMIELMHDAEGIGLAAPQVGLPWRMFVANLPEVDDRSTTADPPTATKGPVVYINPVLSSAFGAPEPFNEGCLSLPDIRGEVFRPPVITITATDLLGKPFTQRGGGLLARCWQHEIDHLDGILILDRMSQMSRLKNKTAVRDLERGL